jgi:hypothetical protein
MRSQKLRLFLRFVCCRRVNNQGRLLRQKGCWHQFQLDLATRCGQYLPSVGVVRRLLRMKLNYSFSFIEPHWFSDDLTVSERLMGRVKVRLLGKSPLYFPAFFEIADLLTNHSASLKRSAVTLLLTYHHSTVPSRTSPMAEGVWHPIPGSPVYGQIRVALPPEAVKLIRPVSAEDHDYELVLDNVELTDVTGKVGDRMHQ